MHSVGLIGVGNMGKGIARNILRKSPASLKLSVYDVNPGIIQDLVKAAHEEGISSKLIVAESVAEVTRSSSIISMSLPSVKVTEEVLFGHNGVASTLADMYCKRKDEYGEDQDVCVLDHGTFPMEFVWQNHKRAMQCSKGRRWRYIDAPVSGGPTGAHNGTLTVMLGTECDKPPASSPSSVLKSSTSVLRRVDPFLRLFSTNVFAFGPPGSGMGAKLVNQQLVSVHAMAACEALALAENVGIKDKDKLEQLAQMLKVSWGQSKIQELVFNDYLAVIKAEADTATEKEKTGREEGTASPPTPPASLRTNAPAPAPAHRSNRRSWAPSAAPLRNLQKDLECVLQCVSTSTAPTANTPLTSATSTRTSTSSTSSTNGSSAHLPCTVASAKAISEACSAGRQDAAFVSLVDSTRAP